MRTKAIHALMKIWRKEGITNPAHQFNQAKEWAENHIKFDMVPQVGHAASDYVYTGTSPQVVAHTVLDSINTGSSPQGDDTKKK